MNLNDMLYDHNTGKNFTHAVSSAVKNSDRAQNKEAIRNKDKSDRATTDQVLDPRTRMILFKMLNQNVITEINGCISTGKEANVYHALLPEGGEAAIKACTPLGFE